MLKAIDKNDNLVLIDNADENEMYFCPICHQPLVQKRGDIREHHFSHIGPRGFNEKSYVPCSDTWHYDKTPWHFQWQKRFADECIEKVITRGNEKHIADVLVNDIVIEFQHSAISIEDFRKRNTFYNACGYKVIWVFDLIEESESGRIDYSEDCDNEYHWSYVKKLFREIDLKSEHATIFFQFDEDEHEEGACVLQRVTNSYNEFRLFYTDFENALSIQSFVQKAKENSFEFYNKKAPVKLTKEIIDSLPDSKTIYELWSENYAWMVVENMPTGKRMLIKGSYGEMWTDKQGRIKGKYSNSFNGKYTYSNDFYVVWDAERPIWRLISSGERTDPSYQTRSLDDTDEKYKGCLTMRQIILQASSKNIIVKCLYNDVTYSIELLLSFDTTRFNSSIIDLETGEIDMTTQNAFVWALYDKKVWKEINI